jgi:hypothetical protein
MGVVNLPIACTLTEAELRERRRSILGSMRDAAMQVAPMPDGYSYEFRATSEVLAQLSHLVDLERQCCPFLTFKIVVAPQRPIRLEVTGPPEAKETIADFFGSDISGART